MLRIVLDTNALLDGSNDDYNFCNRIVNEVIAGNVEAYANDETIKENRLLVDKKIIDSGYSKRLEYFFSKVNIIPTLKIKAVIDDPEDNKIFASAIASNADFLITSDRHLLDLTQTKFKVVTPAQFWSIYQENSDAGWTNWLKKFIS